MSEPKRVEAEKLVEIHKACDEWQGDLLSGYLRDNGIEASFQGEPAVALDVKGMMRSGDESFGIYVLEHDAARAKQLLTEFLAAATDESVLEETAAHKLKVNKETIARLRGALVQERKTFEFLQWVGAIFLVAIAVLWAIWPVWLKTAPPEPFYRWTAVSLLVLAALFVGSWMSRRL